MVEKNTEKHLILGKLYCGSSAMEAKEQFSDGVIQLD
jgi:hypothetical protein